MAEQKNSTATYDDDAIKTLSPREHIRLRPGMYIGKLGDGTQSDDGIYVLLKEVVDNSIDEFIMGAGKRIEITIEDDTVGGARLRPRHTAQIALGCREPDEHRRQVRRRGIQEDSGS